MKLSSALLDKMNFEPTEGQREVFRMFDSFFLDKQKDRKTFLLKGYAGTGKTTIVSLLAKVLPDLGFKIVLLAPTGRAAKVMNSYSGIQASTIHRHIYRKEVNEEGGTIFLLRKNLQFKTVYIVDESSMIDDEKDFGGRGLLTDLSEFIFSSKGNILLLVGDSAQLPPVKKDLSPALMPDYLRRNLNLDVADYELKEVVRQEKKSGILFNATKLRDQINQDDINVAFQTKGFPDIYRMTAGKLEDGIRYAYDKYGREETMILCRSNKAAVQYNQYIRRMIQFMEDEISAGDILMIVRNNYSVLPEDSSAGFLANGDFVEIRKLRNIEEIHGFRFALAEMVLMDNPEYGEFEGRIMLDTLHSPEPSMSQENYKKLYDSVVLDYQDIRTKKGRKEALQKDTYLNALQVKFAYALTCHKSQGGQWKAVFVDQGYLQEETINREFLRWLYTAVTRATNELFLMNFHEKFFNNGRIID